MNPKTQVERAAAYVRKMDAAIEGAGGDAQTFIVACKLVEFGLNSSEALSVLKEYNLRCKPQWDESGLERKLRYAYLHAAPNPVFCDPSVKIAAPKFTHSNRVSKWPHLDIRLRDNIIAKSGFGLFDLFESSPVSFDPSRPATQEVMLALFPGDPLICAGMDSTDFYTNKLSLLGDLSRFQLVVPNPMSAYYGKIKDPQKNRKYSQHSFDNTGPRRYAVIEFDHGAPDEHSALLYELSSYAPFVMAVHSGGKSLHGWFMVEGQPEERVQRFYRYAVSIGADRATFLKSQFVRMPDGLRSNGNRQPIYYFNPKPLEKLCPKN